MNYSPPSETNWVSVGHFYEWYAEAYNEGFLAAALGGKETDNPHKESGYERDGTLEDELNYHWYSGFWDYYYDED